MTRSMFRRWLSASAAVCALVVLAAFALPTADEIVKKAEGIKEPDKLAEVLGEPDQTVRVGGIRRWIYHARDGSVTFLITNHEVSSFATSDERPGDAK